MIRKCLNFGSVFSDTLKNSSVGVNFSRPSLLKNVYRYQNDGSFSCLLSSAGSSTFSHPLVSSSSTEFSLLDSHETEDLKDNETIKTELLELRGPNGAGFLVEVYERDKEEVKEVDNLTGDLFCLDKNIISGFGVKYIVMAEPLNIKRDLLRLVRVHAITTGSEEVYKLEGKNQFLFVNTIDRGVRVKNMLEKLGYKV